MLVTQTYLGPDDPKTDIFVYWFFQDYINQEKDMTIMVEPQLAAIGRAFRNRVTIFLPRTQDRPDIYGELQSNRELWEGLKGKMPGLFLSQYSLSHLRDYPNDLSEAVFISFANLENGQGYKERLAETRATIERVLSESKSGRPLYKNLLDALELKPGIWGLRIDLKKIFKKKRR